MPAVTVAPDVPVPAPAKISPVGLSSTYISIIFLSSFSEFLIFESTDLKIRLDLILLIDLSNRYSL